MTDPRSGSRFRLTSERAAQIATAFLEPCSVAAAADAGFTPDELGEARDAGILISEEDQRRLGLWERYGWSRAAHLLLSQMDIPYRERHESMTDPAALRAERRAAVEEYRDSKDHPGHRWLATGDPVELPEPPEVSPRLSALTSRRSIRGFASRPARAEQMAGALHHATRSIRTAAADRAGGDPFRLLNSFYSWAHLFVVVQGVERMPKGVFEYDWSSHRLLRSAGPPADVELLRCIQGQRGVLGTGFVVFIVADLRRYAWLYRHSRAYLHVLIQIGELGQELLMAATELGLGGWPSPAVHESRSKALLGLAEDDSVDVLSLVKLGPPAARERPRDRRSAAER
jgi:SagB-type dehydrogenase family enzyme